MPSPELKFKAFIFFNEQSNYFVDPSFPTLLNGHKISTWGNEKGLDLDNDNGCTSL